MAISFKHCAGSNGLWFGLTCWGSYWVWQFRIILMIIQCLLQWMSIWWSHTMACSWLDFTDSETAKILYTWRSTNWSSRLKKKKKGHEEIYWKCVSSTDDQAFLLSRMHGIPLCAKEVGVEPNCIYVTLSCSDGERLFKFNVLLPEDIMSLKSRLFWTAPILG